MHLITNAQYLKVRDNEFTVFSFDRKTKERRSTYSGLSLVSAMEEVLKMQAHGAICVVLPGRVPHPYDSPNKGWHLDDYEELLTKTGQACIES